MAKRTAHVPLELDTRGVSFTDFAQAICLQEQLEVSLIRLHITVQQLTFPLCLVAASGLRPQVRPRLGSAGSLHHRQHDGSPQPAAERSRFQMQGQERVPHQLPFPSLLQEALRRVTNIRQETHTLLHIIQNNPLAGNSYAHQCGVRACHEICTEMETLEDALEQIP